MTDLHGLLVFIPFYVTHVNGVLLVGNNVLHKSDALGSENILVIPPKSTPISGALIVLPIYSSPELRTYLQVVPSQKSSFKAYLSSMKDAINPSLVLRAQRAGAVQSGPLGPPASGVSARKFATQLHLYTHLSAPDIQIICERAGVLTPVLK